MRTLIIEDDSLFSEILQTFLEDHDCQTIVANTLAAARAHLSTSVFNFILLDNQLPDGNGLTFISEITDLLSTPTPVMMITAEDNQNVMADAFVRGADDFLIKPISLDLLWQKMQRVRALYSKEAELEEQTQRLEKLIDQREQEESLARYVYEHVAASLVHEEKCIDTYLQSSSTFNGDVFISETAPNGNRIIILADATGHGLAAAISILPLVTTIKAMIRKGLSLAHIVHEGNSKLGKELPDDKFVALAGIEINFNSRQCMIFNGGMPDIIALRHDGKIDRFSSNTMALGILDPDDFDPSITTCESHPYKNFVLYSDGIIEQCNKSGEEFGLERLLNCIKKNKNNESLVSRIINDFTVFNEIQELTDDLSLCDLQVDALFEKHLYERDFSEVKKSGKLSASIEMNGGLMASADIIGCFDSLMRCVDVIGDLRQRAFTVFAELISNALDHGVLGLDSKLKNDMSGFAEYLIAKEERLAAVKEVDALKMSFEYEPSTNHISFSISDTGSGYEVKAKSEMKDASLSGRGLSLINKLCSSVIVSPPGNKTEVTLKREF
ncbi:ATP-binding SpoIIE family protein phosphatase [Glaciecola sp. 1036]|uniref:ATP-binding SpoIIE family protein phosphatase n=1 Tax=Alteromonadaceae TaxID=72275 RepID=UPI003D06131B